MDPRVQAVAELIRGTLDRPLALDELSHGVNLSASRLRHLFKLEIGTTPSRYLKNLRLQTARNLVATTFLNVKEVMVHVGIGDESHFVRDFERLYGSSPRRYRDAKCPRQLPAALCLDKSSRVEGETARPDRPFGRRPLSTRRRLR
jgi:transcriptional regulator GlxA family with amidase domain